MEKNTKEKTTTSEKHPKLNSFFSFLVGLVIFGATGYVIVQILQYIVKTVSKLIAWVSQTVPKLDAVIIVALITSAVSIIGIVVSSIVAKSLEYKRARREYLTMKREEPYGEFVDMIYRIQESTKPGKEYPQEEVVNDIMRFSKKMTLWGSSRVVNNWVKFKENAVKGDKGFDNLLLTETIMNDMRKDLGLRRVKKGNLLAFFVNDIKDAIKKNANK